MSAVMESACDMCGLVNRVRWYDEDDVEGTDLQPGGYCVDCAYEHGLIESAGGR